MPRTPVRRRASTSKNWPRLSLRDAGLRRIRHRLSQQRQCPRRRAHSAPGGRRSRAPPGPPPRPRRAPGARGRAPRQRNPPAGPHVTGRPPGAAAHSPWSSAMSLMISPWYFSGGGRAGAPGESRTGWRSRRPLQRYTAWRPSAAERGECRRQRPQGHP